MTHTVTRLLTIPLLLAVLVFLAACGDDDTSAGSATTPGTSLQFTLWPEGKGTTVDSSTRSVIACAEGDTDADCAALLALGDEVWAPVPANAPCTKIFGGPGVAEVTGFVGGRAVTAVFNRSGGCEMRRWDAAVPLLQRLAARAGGWTAFPATDLKVTHFPRGVDDPAGGRTLTVACPEAPEDTDKDCQELLDLGRGDLFDAALSPGTVCTQVFGGPGVVRVAGILAGRNVDTTFNRTDGCQIDRWDRAVPLLLRMGRP